MGLSLRVRVYGDEKKLTWLKSSHETFDPALALHCIDRDRGRSDGRGLSGSLLPLRRSVVNYGNMEIYKGDTYN